MAMGRIVSLNTVYDLFCSIQQNSSPFNNVLPNYIDNETNKVNHTLLTARQFTNIPWTFVFDSRLKKIIRKQKKAH